MKIEYCFNLKKEFLRSHLKVDETFGILFVKNNIKNEIFLNKKIYTQR